MSRWLDLRLNAGRWRTCARLLGQLERIVAAVDTIGEDREQRRFLRHRLARLQRQIDEAITELQPALTREELRRWARDETRQRARGHDEGTD